MNISPTIKVTFTISLFILAVILSAFFVKRIFYTPPIIPTIENTSSKQTKVIQVHVVNATGNQGVAKKLMDYLRHRGFDVVEISNSTDSRTTTEVIDRVGDSVMIHQVAYAIGINNRHIITDIDSNLYLHCTVLIGSDYNSLKPFK